MSPAAAQLGGVLEQAFVQIPLRAVLAFAIVLVVQLPVIYGLLKIHSHIMSRVGPMYAGRFHGVGQPIAEAIKWIQKEDIIPANADRWVFSLAPIVALVPSIMIFAVIPIAPGFVAADMELGLLYALAIAAVGVIGVIMAAYGAQSKFTLIGGLRGVAQLTAYELPVIVGALSMAMLAGSLNLTEIVEAQGIPFVVWPLPFGVIAFAIFLTGSIAEVMWPPFDMPVAESEIIAGPFTEYSGMRFIFFQMSEFTHMIALSALTTVLFLGGWQGPDVLPPVVWFLAKVSIFVVFYIWVRFTLPRLREDQLQKFAWKFLIPVGLANMLGIAFYRVLTA